MRKRNIDKHIWFSRDEAQELQKKAKKACLSEGALIRLLIRGYEPREKPDDRFYITNVGAGHGLIKVGSSLIPFANKFPKNTKLYKLMTTKPGEGV